MGFRSRAIAVVAAMAISAIPPGAASGNPERPVAFTDLQFGRLLFEAGRLEDARAFLEQAEPAGDDEAVARLFMLGRIEMRLGLPRAAARRFEQVLARRPDLTAARLELATAYYAAERDGKARYHFEQSLADRLPSPVETQVRRFLDRIDNRRRWSSSLSVALAPESNPARRTASRTVRIGGAPWQLDPDSRSASGTGVRIAGGTSFSPPVSEDLTGVLAATGSAKLYRRSEWNDISVAGDIGLAAPLDRAAVSGGVRLGRRWFGEDGYSRSIGVWTRGWTLLSDRTRIGMAAEIARIDHDDDRIRDGWRLGMRPGLFHALGGTTAIEAELDLESVSAREKRLGSRMAGIGVTFAHAFEGGLSVRPGLGVWFRRFRGRDPIFGKTRTDTTIRPSLTVLHRALQYEGFAPHVGYSFETARSNIPIHAYRNHAVLFGISRRF